MIRIQLPSCCCSAQRSPAPPAPLRPCLHCPLAAGPTPSETRHSRRGESPPQGELLKGDLEFRIAQNSYFLPRLAIRPTLHGGLYGGGSPGGGDASPGPLSPGGDWPGGHSFARPAAAHPAAACPAAAVRMMPGEAAACGLVPGDARTLAGAQQQRRCWATPGQAKRRLTRSFLSESSPSSFMLL